MPLQSWDTKAVWDQAYEFDAEPEGVSGRPMVRLHYNRFVSYPWHRDRIIRIAQLLGWNSATRLVIAGSAYGWSMEALLDELGFTQVLGVDTSAYIQNSKATNEDAEISAAITAVGLNPTTGEGLTLFNRFRGEGLPRARRATLVLNENLSSNASRNRVRSAMGAPHTYEIFTEDMLTSLTDAECLLASQNAHQVTSGRVSHLVTVWPVGSDPFMPLNVKRTLQAWKDLIPTDTWIDASTFEVL